MVAVGLREETTTRSTLGLLSLDSMAVQTQNCTLSADRNDFKRRLFLFGLKSEGGPSGILFCFPFLLASVSRQSKVSSCGVMTAAMDRQGPKSLRKVPRV